MLEHLRQVVQQRGGDLLGVAEVGRFDAWESDPTRRAAYFLSSARSIIVIGLKVVDAIFDPLRGKPDPFSETLKGYLRNYNYNLLDFIAVQTARYLEDLGFDAYPIQARITNRDNDSAVFSHKPAALLAGLGTLGKNGLVITPQYGPRARLVSVITNAPLPAFEGQPAPSGSICEDCNLCIQSCPTQALSYNEELHRTVVDRARCREAMNEFQCALCQAICPFGHRAAKRRRTLQGANNADSPSNLRWT